MHQTNGNGIVENFPTLARTVAANPAYNEERHIDRVPITITYSDKPKRPVMAHGLMLVDGLLYMMRQYRPQFFFGVTGLLIILASLALGGHIVVIYQNTRTLAVGYAMIPVLLAIIGILTLFSGIILHSIRGLLLDHIH